MTFIYKIIPANEGYNLRRDKIRFLATSQLLVPSLVATLLARPAFAQADSVRRSGKSSGRIRHSSKNSSSRHRLDLPHGLSAERKMIGQYVYANGSAGLVLDLFDNRNYRLFLHSDVVDPSDLDDERNKSYGTWRLGKEGNLVVTPQDSERKLRYLSHPTTFYPVHWGMRTYLLSEADFPAFKKAIASGQEPRHESWGNAFFLLGLGDEKKPATGFPVFPERWRGKNKNNASMVKPIVKPSPNF